MIEEYPEAMAIRKKSPYFHSEDKGCELEDRKAPYNEKNKTHLIKIKYCKTHKVDNICRCGWLYGHHFEKG